MADLRLYMFECGTLKCKLHNIKMNQGLNEPYEIPVPWFLIQHPKGNIVIDGGNAVECVNNPHALGWHHRCLLSHHDRRTGLCEGVGTLEN